MVDVRINIGQLCEKPIFVTYEDESKEIKIARKGSKGYLKVRKFMDPEDTGSVSGIVLVAEAVPSQEPITPHAHKGYEESICCVGKRKTTSWSKC